MQQSLPLSALKAAQFDGLIISPEHSEYENARRVWNGMIDRRPLAIVRPHTQDDIVKVVQIAKRFELPLAIRCGGHSFPGFSTCDDGVVLDLSQMNKITIDPKTRVANVEGGALLGAVDAAGAPHGLVVPAGVVSHTGVAGLTLGGGMGWNSRRFGLTIDSLLGVDLVTANGEIIHASADQEPELFWGLRGGGGNFGIVTKFYFRMHELGDVITGTWIYPMAQGESALQHLAEHALNAPRELTSSFVVMRDQLKVTAFWSGQAGKGHDHVSSFGHLAGSGDGTFGPTDFPEFQGRSDELAAWGRRYYVKSGFLAKLDHAAISCLLAALSSSPAADCEILVNQLGGAVADVSDEATAYTGRKAAFFWLVQPIWDDPKDDIACLAWGRKIAAELAALSMEGNYVNEQAEIGGDLVVKAYGAEKFRRLQELKTKFDPTNLFRLNQNIVSKYEKA